MGWVLGYAIGFHSSMFPRLEQAAYYQMAGILAQILA